MAEYGMLAFGRCGKWELAVDELIGESPNGCCKSRLLSFPFNVECRPFRYLAT
ncbi:MAG: hypothetical protein JWP89_5453 [Schlesneria sp.]|nr:hypothetical protein [Schlesneria sp.]